VLSSAQEAQLQQLIGAQSTSPGLAQKARVICRSALRERTERCGLSTQTKAHLLGVQTVRRDAQGLTAHVILAAILHDPGSCRRVLNPVSYYRVKI
jgi:hypothetical protein